MSMKVEFEDLPVKDELLESEGVDEKVWNHLVKSEVLPESRDNKKCGEVLIGSRGNFTLVCVLCTENFPNLETFGLHIHTHHVPNDLAELTGSTASKLDPLGIAQCENTQLPAYSDIEIELVTASDLVDTGLDDADDSDYFDSKHDGGQDAEASRTDIGSSPTTKANNDDSFCSLCCRSYKTRKSYIQHMKKQHSENVEDTSEPSMTTSPEKPKSKSASNSNTMTCKYCDKGFSKAKEFREHLGTHTGSKRFVCPHCPKVFASRYNRQVHINTHTGERPYKCTHCPKAFADATNLEMHIRMHLGIMKFSCDYCDKRFVQSTEKKVHERTHTGEKPFQCEECGKRFISRVKLTDHGKRHKNIKNYKCELCDKTFYSSNLLKDHMPVHTNERPFHCNVCGQDFPRRKSLRAHQQLHSDEKKYVCHTCGKAFAQCAGLYAHKKWHEKPV